MATKYKTEWRNCI